MPMRPHAHAPPDRSASCLASEVHLLCIGHKSWCGAAPGAIAGGWSSCPTQRTRVAPPHRAAPPAVRTGVRRTTRWCSLSWARWAFLLGLTGVGAREEPSTNRQMRTCTPQPRAQEQAQPRAQEQGRVEVGVFATGVGWAAQAAARAGAGARAHLGGRVCHWGWLSLTPPPRSGAGRRLLER